MKRVKNVKQKILLTFLYAVCLFLLTFLGAKCIFKYLFNIPCPGCGMTRAWLSVLKFDFKAAFSYHPMFWSMPILYLYFWLDGRLFKKAKIDKVILISIASGFVINWIIQLFLYC